MKNVYLLILVLMSVLPATNIIAQDDVEVIDFGETETDNNKNQYGLILKTNPFSVINSWNFIEAEKSITGLVSFQAGVGITYGYRLIETSGLFDDQFDFSNGADSDFRKNKIGTYFSLSPKLYFDEDSPDGSYVSLAFTYAKRKSESLQIIDNGNGGYMRSPNVYDSEHQSDISFTGRWGYQYLYETLSVEYFVGIGFIKSKGEKVLDGYDYSTGEDLHGLTGVDKRNILLELGVRLGFQL